MELRLDISESFTPSTNARTLPEVLVEISDFLEGRGRTLQGVMLDGQDIPPEQLTVVLRNKMVDDVKTLAIRSASIRELVLESIAEVVEVLPELPVACQQLSSVIAGDAPEEGFKPFNDLLDIWEVLEERQRQAGDMLGFGLGEIEVDGETVQKHRATVRDLIAQARAALEESKFIPLSQLLAYELSERAEREQPIMDALRQRAEAS